MENRCEEIIRPTLPDRWRQSTTKRERLSRSSDVTRRRVIARWRRDGDALLACTAADDRSTRWWTHERYTEMRKWDALAALFITRVHNFIAVIKAKVTPIAESAKNSVKKVKRTILLKERCWGVVLLFYGIWAPGPTPKNNIKCF